jgi:hypothetical protein
MFCLHENKKTEFFLFVKIEVKNERKAISIGSKKFSQHTARLLGLLSKNKWPGNENLITLVQKNRLEVMITFLSYLRDVFDALVTRKIRDINDFEWQKCFRIYTSDDNGQPVSFFNSLPNL